MKRVLTGLLVLCGIVTMVIIGFGVFRLATMFHFVEISKRGAPEFEVQRNPYYALGLFLEDAQLEVQHTHFAGPPIGFDAAFLMAENRDGVDLEPEVLLRSGARHIILGAGEGPDAFLASLGFLHLEAAQERDPDSDDEKLYDVGAPVFFTHPEADWVAENSTRVVAVSAMVEGRRLTILRSSVARNFVFESGDNARLIRDILQLEPLYEEDHVVISAYARQVSWMSYVLSKIHLALIVLLVMLVLAIHRAAKRFGPLIAAPTGDRRSRRNHVEAIGRFLYRNHGRERLLAATRAAFIRDATLRMPSLRVMEKDQLLAALAQALEVSPNEIFAIMNTTAPQRESEFVELIEKLEMYRRKL